MPTGVYDRTKEKPEATGPKKPIGRPPKTAAPANDGAYAAVLFDLGAKRDALKAEILVVERAIEALEAI